MAATLTAPAIQARPKSFAAPWVVFWTALLVRLLYITLAHTWRVRPYEWHFGFGWEMGRIARALVTGYGYADPFHGHTGPTAWVTPLYPLVIAGAFKLFGVYTGLSAWVLLAMNCVLNALVVRTTYEIAARCFNVSIARWSAWIWALYPAAMQYAVKWIWEMTLTAFLFSWALVLALRMRRVGEPDGAGATAARWVCFGLVWGLIALSNPEVCIMLPVLGVWVLVGELRPAQFGRAALAGALCLAIIAPWSLRNWRVFHAWVPLRGNFGAELYLGNGPGAAGLLMEYDHPGEDMQQLAVYGRMGEVRYARMRGERAKQVIRSDWERFLRLSATRLYYFWFSVPHPSDDSPLVEYGRNLNYQFTSIAGLLGLALALRRRMPAAGVFAGCFLLLPLLYYFVTVHARFRHPFEPLIAILAVYLFQSAEKWWTVRWFAGSGR